MGKTGSQNDTLELAATDSHGVESVVNPANTVIIASVERVPAQMCEVWNTT